MARFYHVWQDSEFLDEDGNSHRDPVELTHEEMLDLRGPGRKIILSRRTASTYVVAPRLYAPRHMLRIYPKFRTFNQAREAAAKVGHQVFVVTYTVELA